MTIAHIQNNHDLIPSLNQIASFDLVSINIKNLTDCETLPTFEKPTFIHILEKYKIFADFENETTYYIERK